MCTVCVFFRCNVPRWRSFFQCFSSFAPLQFQFPLLHSAISVKRVHFHANYGNDQFIFSSFYSNTTLLITFFRFRSLSKCSSFMQCIRLVNWVYFFYPNNSIQTQNFEDRKHIECVFFWTNWIQVNAEERESEENNRNALAFETKEHRQIALCYSMSH